MPIKVINFSTDLMNGGLFLRVYYQVYDFGEGAMFIWIGNQSASLQDLSYSLPPALPATTSLLQGLPAERSSILTRQLVTKYQKPVFCSYSLPSSTPLSLLLAAEKALFEALEQHYPSSSSS